MLTARSAHLLTLAVGLGLVLGCGGGTGPGGPPGMTGSVEIRIDWPTRSRYVPTYANSLTARITTALNQQYNLTINRTGDAGYTGVAMFTSPIPVGTHTLTVSAYTQANGQGSKVAQATRSVTVEENETTSVNVSADLQSTIHHLEIDGQPINIETGQQRQLAGHAEDAANNLILLPTGALVWSLVSGSEYGAITPSGMFSANAAGVARVKLEEQGIQISVEADVTIVNPPPPPPTYRVAFVTDRYDTGSNGYTAIVTMLSDGTGLTRLTNEDAVFRSPSYNANGSKIVFASDRDSVFITAIYVMNADGSNITRLTDHWTAEADPAFSPDGSLIAFTRVVNGYWQIYLMNADGSNITQLTTGSSNKSRPKWDPSGTKIVFESDAGGDLEIWIMNRDGSGQTQLTTNSVDDFAPSFRPDGQKIVFVSMRVTGGDLFTMDANGSSQARLASLSGEEDDPQYTPDGLQIVFSRDMGAGFYDIWIVKANGTSAFNLSSHSAHDSQPTVTSGP